MHSFVFNFFSYTQGRIKDFKLGGGTHLKKLRRAEGGAKIFGVFRVKHHDFTPKNHIFSNFRVCQYVNTTDLIFIEHYIGI